MANNATVNNYLKHAELVKKDAELKACATDECRTKIEAKWDKVSQDRNAQIQDSCINGGAQACRANIAEMQADLAELAKNGTGKGLNQYTPEESNNIKQLLEKYRTNLEELASIAQSTLGTTYGSPSELAYLTPQEAKDLQNFRAGTFIDVAGAVILPGGIKVTGKSGKQIAEEIVPPPNARPWAGSGPARGVIGITDDTPVTALQNYYPRGGGTEFVYDPATRTFAAGKPARGQFDGSAHEQLARSIGANESKVVGGTMQRGPNGEFYTNENSGHYGQNWTPEIRADFQKWLSGRANRPVDHQSWGN
ncbi:polymorphic toxin type 43 domain-containing protein [Variovorax sp. MHTC-1]|uniref:polymorphic toxin type 43 domain-containing protein n=1 Tax=Variovorax sp. MHTC-1 TaxID=2495593 RepID=UPI00163C53E4|nr:polymorphic toxin type 43 domain-containing protein [Variovorax sp. MHTC-1]